MASSWSSAASEPDHDPDFEDVTEKASPIDLPTERLAMVSIVAGIAGFFLPIVGPVTAIVSGHVARDEIRKSKGRLGGDGLARTGMVLGYVWVALTLTALLFVVSFTFVMIKRDPEMVRVRTTGVVRGSESWVERMEANTPPPPPIVLNEIEAAPGPPRATIRFLSPSKVAETIELQRGFELRRFRPSLPSLPLPSDDPDAT